MELVECYAAKKLIEKTSATFSNNLRDLRDAYNLARILAYSYNINLEDIDRIPILIPSNILPVEDDKRKEAKERAYMYAGLVALVLGELAKKCQSSLISQNLKES